MGHLVVLSPPLIVSKAQIDEAAEAMRGAIKAVTDGLMRDGLWQEKAA
jgi:adenosylmethionine-8-amino-7-oxononanoate aminotransferase